MDRFISDEQWRRLAEWITFHMGLHMPRERLPDLKRRLLSAAREFHFDSIEPFVSWLLSTKLTQRQIETLASHLTVGETYFFRETASLEALEKYILPELIESRRSTRSLRVWSAGCATGEEPYTIAIMLSRLIPDISKWQVTLLATDINARSLERASQGIYREWSFRGDFQWLKDQYFTRTLDGRYRISEKIRKMVTFNYLNLATDTYPSLYNNTNAMDIIFCRNVLMYLEPSLAKRVVGRFYRALIDEGWVLPSVTEGFHLLFTRFVAVTFPGVTLYQKRMDQRGTLEIYHHSRRNSKNDAAVKGQTELGEWASLSTAEPLPSDSIPERKTEPSRMAPSVSEFPPSAAMKEIGEEALHESALRLFKEGRYSECEQILTSLLEQYPESFHGQALMARLHADQGRLPEAQEWCEKAISNNKLDAGCHYLLAVIFIEQRRFGDAEQSLHHALYLDPDFVLAHFTLGNLVREEGRKTLSSKHFEHALLLLQNYQPEEILPESDGVTAGRLKDIILMADLGRSNAPGA
ncbi:CheR family methyltransferase [Syntrophus aciditrophicus]|uniref:Chemotaxis protein methyltransferase n=1 Tax=Syntrophus aciditrophicus (strain SB) TaxID=56780 RepID=Q2LR61_SYNAS|nr:protein-glutamate O-methyltransferase CheR [Syntrophus aciditrophicus]ABC76568.1 chemotaxis protein methyltransferase [Syntrophus aciditrophicus SB]OPY18365.1 MAG: Chemotaxis protein methyltransferase [Syntrophus sp. PtaB.Bin075]